MTDPRARARSSMLQAGQMSILALLVSIALLIPTMSLAQQSDEGSTLGTAAVEGSASPSVDVEGSATAPPAFPGMGPPERSGEAAGSIVDAAAEDPSDEPTITWGGDDPVELPISHVTRAAAETAEQLAGLIMNQALSVASGRDETAVEAGSGDGDGSAVPTLVPEFESLPQRLDRLADEHRMALAAAAAELARALDAERRAALDHLATEDPSTAGLTVDELRSHRLDIEILLAGRLPENLTTENLFTADLRSDDAVRRRSRELESDIGVRRAALELVGDQLTEEQHARATALIELLLARKAFLDSPVSTRRAVLEAEVQAAALRIQQQEADRERQRARAEEARAREAQEAALAEARAAANELDRRIATERARLERVRADLASFRVMRSNEAAQRAALLQARLDQTFEFRERVANATPESDAAMALYAAIRDESAQASQVLQEALRVAEADTGIPEFTLDATLVNNPDVSAARLAELRESENQLLVDIQTVENDMATRRLSNVYEAAEYEELVEELRLEVLRLLPRHERRAELGFGRRGLATLRGEVARLGVVFQLTTFRAQHLSSEFRDLHVVGSIAVRLLLAMVLLLAYLQLRRSGWPIQIALRNALNRRARTSSTARSLALTVGVLSGVYPEMLLFITVLLIGQVLGSTVDFPALALMYSLGFWYAGYRLTLATVHRLLDWVARRGRLTVSDQFSGDLLRSLTIVGRYVFIVGTTLGLSEAVLGRGYLYTLVSSFAWIGFFPIAFVLSQRWKIAIADAYLTLRASGALSDIVRDSRDRWYGFAVAIIAFLVLAGMSTISAMRSFAMGFEQTRRAVAYMFRRRIERNQTTSAVSAIDLPPDLDAVLTTDPTEHDGVIDEFNKAVQRFTDDFTDWLRTERVGSFLIVSDIGLGKSTCMRLALRAADGLPQVSIHLSHRVLDERELVSLLAEGFGITDACVDIDDLIAALLRGPRRLASIDNFERLFLRGIMTDGSMKAVERLITETGHHVYWFCAISVYPWEYLRWRKRAAMFRDYFVIERWKEVSIERMLEHRTAALGREVRYDSLFAGDLEGVSDSSAAANTISDIARLLWDYSDGSPAVTMHCWRHMLVPQADGSLRVRLFPQKNSELLERLSEEERFTLACVVWHTSISEAHAALALRYAPQTARDALRRLREIGVVARSGTMYHLTVDWTAPALRYLRRKHLIS